MKGTDATPGWVHLAFATLSFAFVIGCSAQHPRAPAVVPPVARAEQFDIPGISDEGKVNEFLYRGTQPKEEGLEQLKRLAIDIIVDLRGERHGLMEKEREQAEALGMRLVNIPGNGWTPHPGTTEKNRDYHHRGSAG